MAVADIGHDHDIRRRHAAQPVHLPEVINAHFDYRRLVFFLDPQQG